jgi:hypothetical protein
MSEANEPLAPRKGSRVRLREGFDKVYPLSFSGAEGVIEEYTVDPEGFERIRVRWDRNHWRHNGERDMFTYLGHFEVIAPPELPKAPEPEELPEPAVQRSAHPQAEHELLKRLLAASPEENPLADQFADMLAKSVEVMQTGTAFMLVTISPEPDGSGKLAPYFFSGMLDDESATACQLAYTQIAGDVIKGLSHQFRKGGRNG